MTKNEERQARQLARNLRNGLIAELLADSDWRPPIKREIYERAAEIQAQR